MKKPPLTGRLILAQVEGIEPSLHGFGDRPTTVIFHLYVGTGSRIRTEFTRFTGARLIAIKHSQHGVGWQS